MRYQSNISKMSKTHKMVLISILVSLALVLSFFERSLQINFWFPGVKIGLANIITLSSLYFLTFGEAFLLVILRVGLGALFTSPISFFYSLSGGLLSLITMYILVKYSSNKFSTIGISVIGAVSHNIGQLMVIAVITEISVALSYFPILAVSGVITGVVIGIVVRYLLSFLVIVFNGRT